MTRHRVGLDIRMLQNSGIGTYLRGLLSGLGTLGLENDLALFGPTPTETRPDHVFSAPIYSIQEQFQYPARLKQCRLWHAPHYNVPLLKGKTKLVVTIHDIIHWIFRKQFLTPLWQKSCFRPQTCSSWMNPPTISQQLAKNLYLSPSKNPVRKIKKTISAGNATRKKEQTQKGTGNITTHTNWRNNRSP